MAHHHHHDDDTYLLDRICMVALSGAFGVICLCLFFVQKDMLYLLLGPQFHYFVLASGFILVAIAALKAGQLWSMSRVRKRPREAYASLLGHGGCSGDHSHSHAHEAHQWAPWRYVMLLAPIILYLLGLPNQGPSIDVDRIPKLDTSSDLRDECIFSAGLAGFGGGLNGIGIMAGREAANALADDVELVSVKKLKAMAWNLADRNFYQDKTVHVRGQYVGQSERYFDLVRFDRYCCGADAVMISVPVIAKDSIAFGKVNIWIDVTGRVDFRKETGGFKTVVIVSDRRQVRPCNPDLNPYMQ